MKTFDCHGDFPSLGAFLFKINANEKFDTIIGVNIGLKGVELLISGRFRAKRIEYLLKYTN